MLSTGYESLNRHPGGDSISSNGGMKSSGKAMQKNTLPLGSSSSLKSSHSVKKDGGTSLKNSKASLSGQPNSSKSEVLFHAATPSSKPGARKASPAVEDLEAPALAANIGMDRNVRQRPDQGTPYNLLHLDPHAENVFRGNVPLHVRMDNQSGIKTLPN